MGEIEIWPALEEHVWLETEALPDQFATTETIDPFDSGHEPRPGATLASAVYSKLRHDILSGILLPGSKLRTEFLRERYQVGNSPIREALNRLSAEGFVSRRDQKGFHVAGVSKADLLETIRTRVQLEEIALRESIERGGREWEEGIVLANYRLSMVDKLAPKVTIAIDPEWERLHGDFHRALISACGSRWLLQFCQQLMDRADRYRRLAMTTNTTERSEVDEHRAITEATTARRADEAVQLLTAHYTWTADIIIKSLPAILES